jgi:Ca2+-binding RTX toxin-like protein
MRFPTRTTLAAGILAAGLAATADAQASPAPKVTRGVLVVSGSNANDKLALRLQAGNPNKIEIDFGDNGTADFRVNRNLVNRIRVKTLRGDDQVRIDDANGAFTDTIPTTLNGGRGNDTLLGGRGNETLKGGPGKDTVDGNQGNDTGILGAGDDTFIWDPGDGSDIVEGRRGHDAMTFNGASIAETMDLSANGTRARFTRNVGNIVMDLNDVEQVDVAAKGGNDILTTNDVTGTDVTTVNEDLGEADGAADQAIVNGTNANDAVTVSGGAGSVAVAGLATTVNLAHTEPANDKLTVNSLGGNDTVNAAALNADSVKYAVDGGAGDDTLPGSRGVDTEIGGDGNDTIDGNQGNDLGLLGAGDDTFIWDPGDGSDTVEGQDGRDRMLFNGANVNENFDISANGGRVRFTRNVANIVMDLNDVERIDTNALGGTDNLQVNDVTGTDLTEVNGDVGENDGAADQVIVNGTNGDDVASVSGSAGSASVLGLAARVNVSHANAAQDKLVINGLAGDDVVEASGLAADAIGLEAHGNDGDDILVGGAGADTLAGEAGDDVLIGGPGVDALDGGPGNNTIIQ